MLTRQLKQGVAALVLDRPQQHNAFNAELIAALNAALLELDQQADVRAVVITGAGSTFSAGADVNWMRDMARASEQDNLADSLKLAELMRNLCFLSKPTIARVNGAAYGGGVGLIACCDIAIGVQGAKFSLSEVKLGLVPAVISPYVIASMGLRAARRYFISGEVFDDQTALRYDLLHESVSADQLDESVDRAIHWLGKGGPIAQREAKMLSLRMSGMSKSAQEKIDTENAALIAKLRVSAEGQEGLSAFLDKRAANWIKS